MKAGIIFYFSIFGVIALSEGHLSWFFPGLQDSAEAPTCEELQDDMLTALALEFNPCIRKVAAAYDCKLLELEERLAALENSTTPANCTARQECSCKDEINALNATLQALLQESTEPAGSTEPTEPEDLCLKAGGKRCEANGKCYSTLQETSVGYSTAKSTCEGLGGAIWERVNDNTVLTSCFENARAPGNAAGGNRAGTYYVGPDTTPTDTSCPVLSVDVNFAILPTPTERNCDITNSANAIQFACQFNV